MVQNLSFLEWGIVKWSYFFTYHIQLWHQFLKAFEFQNLLLTFSWLLFLVSLENQSILILSSIMLSFVIWCHAVKKSLNFPAINLDLAPVLPSSIFYYLWNQLLLYLAPFLPWAETFLEGCQICECCWLLLYLSLLLLCLPLMLLCLSNDLT